MERDSSLATVLFTDIVGSTERAAELRDAGWRDLRQEHDRCVRRELRRFRGREINTAGDSFLATFTRPARAITCAGAIRAAVRELGLEIRAGLHMGELEGAGRDLGGLALNIGARVAAEADPGEILVSRSVHDALAGSAFDFEDRGMHRLKGVPGEWRLFAVTSVPAEAGEARPIRWKRALAQRRAILGGVVTAGLLLLTGLYLARREPVSVLTPEEAAAADEAEEAALAANADPGIAVLPFTVNDASQDPWREAMVDLLAVNLDGFPDLRAIDSRTALARWEEAVPDTVRADLATALAVARRTGARYAVVGSAVAAGPDLRLTAEVYEARGGAKLGSAQVTGAPDSILVLVDRLSLEIVRTLPRESGVLADFDLAEVTTDSLDALKAYLSGEALYRRADFGGAAAAFERAIASDSLFALAWVRLFNTCGWADSELCARGTAEWLEAHYGRLPVRVAEMQRASWQIAYTRDPREGLEARRRMARKYPDDPEAWYWLGDGIVHWGAAALLDRTGGVRALERAIELAPTTHAKPYIHLIEHALAEADSARAARLLTAYERLTGGSGDLIQQFRLAFALAFADSTTRARTLAALDTVSTPVLSHALFRLGNPRHRAATREAVEALFARPVDHRDDFTIRISVPIHYSRGQLRRALAVSDHDVRSSFRAVTTYALYLAGMGFPPDELKRVLAAGVADSVSEPYSGFLLVGAYAVDRGEWDEYAIALDRQRSRARRLLAEGDSVQAWQNEGMARALEGYELWKRDRKAEALPALEAAHRQMDGFGRPFSPHVIVRWWLGELLLELGRPRDAVPYFESIFVGFWIPSPFAAHRLGSVYEGLGEYEKARESYEYALMSWEDPDPELQPRIREARQALARLPKPIRRENP